MNIDYYLKSNIWEEILKITTQEEVNKKTHLSSKKWGSFFQGPQTTSG